MMEACCSHADDRYRHYMACAQPYSYHWHGGFSHAGGRPSARQLHTVDDYGKILPLDGLLDYLEITAAGAIILLLRCRFLATLF